MKKRKLLIFHPALAPYRIDFFNMINDKFNASFYFNLINVSDQKFDQEALKGKCTFKSNYLLNGIELFGRSFRTGIVSIIIKEDPEIILCSEYGPVTLMVFLYKFFFRRKFMLFTLSDDSIDNSKSRNGIRAYLRNIISKNINGVVFPSKEVCNWFNENISPKVKTLELPIIHNDEVFRSELTNSIKIANNNIFKYNLVGKKVILYVGRLVGVKNLPVLIRSIAQLKSTEWKFLIVGDGDQEDYLKELVKNQNIGDKTHFVGRQEGLELSSWYVFSQIFVLPSTYERFGAVVNEALLGGCKVLCSKLAGASSLINENNGKLFNPYLEEELIFNLEKMLTAIDPLTNEIDTIRKNLMPFSFKQKVDELFKELY